MSNEIIMKKLFKITETLRREVSLLSWKTACNEFNRLDQDLFKLLVKEQVRKEV